MSSRSGTESALLAKALPACADSDHVFNEPWEAKAFAIIVKMAEDGHFSWGEWVEVFSQEVATATEVEAAGGKPKTYYEQWLDAAEKLMAQKGVISQQQLAAKRFAIGAVGPTRVMT
ncbi:MAG: nitrile hydratase accessory protein [Burkholderiaceae bacterium]